MLQPLVEGLCAEHMPATRIMTYGATVQIERGMVDLEERPKRTKKNHSQGPKLTVLPSNAIDCDHLIAIAEVDVFYTHDAALAAIARRAAKRFALTPVTICDSPESFERAVRAGASA